MRRNRPKAVLGNSQRLRLPSWLIASPIAFQEAGQVRLSKGDWPHLTGITDPAALDAELHRIRTEYNTVRLHAAIGYVTPDDEHHGRGPAIRRACAAGSSARGKNGSSTIEHSDLHSTERVHAPVGKRGAFEGVARRHGRRRNPARMTPRSSLRTPSQRPLYSSQRWVEKRERSIKGSETPHHRRPLPR